MNKYLRALDASQQVGLLFVVLFGFLLLWTLFTWAYDWRRSALDPEAHAHDSFGDDAHKAQSLSTRQHHVLLRASWVWVAVFWLAWLSGKTTTVVLAGFISFFTLREFLTLSPMRHADHKTLMAVFYFVLPFQYFLILQREFDLFTIFVPVFVFFGLAFLATLGNDAVRFFQRTAQLQWGVMVCIYGVSHVPALLLLPFEGYYADRNFFVLFWLFAVVQSCLMVQHALNAWWPGTPSVPNISGSFSWRNAGLAILAGMLVGGLMSVVTPFKIPHAFLLALVACSAGVAGRLIMKALRRERAVPHWGGHSSASSLTGATGLLDKVDGLCFAAPVFFQSVRWLYDL